MISKKYGLFNIIIIWLSHSYRYNNYLINVLVTVSIPGLCILDLLFDRSFSQLNVFKHIWMYDLDNFRNWSIIALESSGNLSFGTVLVLGYLKKDDNHPIPTYSNSVNFSLGHLVQDFKLKYYKKFLIIILRKVLSTNFEKKTIT